MHQERIITGIEKVFENYAQDLELREALRTSSHWLQLFETSANGYYLFPDGKIFKVRARLVHGFVYRLEDYSVSSPRQAAEDCFKYLNEKYLEAGIFNFTLTKAKAMLEQDLGARVEALKRDYARHFEHECDRRAESRYTQHPEA